MIKRYDFEEGYPFAVECEDGGYVDYDDHAAELATLRKEQEALITENERLREALVEIARQFEMPNGHMAAYLAKEALK